MMNGNSGSVVRSSGEVSRVSDGAARVDEIAWELPELFWWDRLPQETRSGAPHAGVLASGVYVANWAPTIVDGEPCDLAIGWRAYAGSLFVARASRSRQWLTANNGRRGQEPPFSHLDKSMLQARGPVTRTAGIVPAGVRAPGAAGGGAPREGLAPEGMSAEDALAMLPPVVARGVTSLVPDPQVWAGTASERHSPRHFGRPWRYTIELVRADANRAVVLTAVKGYAANSAGDGPATMPPENAREDLATRPWEVTQLVYELVPPEAPAPAAALPVSTRRRLLLRGR